jgi:iron(III) transport system ATP-binding protein
MAADIRIQNIALSYDGGKSFVLKDINLHIAAGEFFALLGASGSGKSTLLRLIAGFNSAQKGLLTIGGEDVTNIPPWKRDVGMVFQSYALWPHMTVAQNIAFGLEERKWPRAKVAAQVEKMLDLVGLTGFAARRPNQLSGGQQQRVALARTLAIEPRVLLLDEPLSNLDAKLRVNMREELKRLQRSLGLTTVFVTHDQEEALTTSDRIAVMDQGVIQQVGSPVELYDEPVNRFVANFIGSVNLLPVQVESVTGDTATVSGSVLGRVSLRYGNTAGGESLTPLNANGKAEVAVRPLSMHLAPKGTGAQADDIVTEGTVGEHEFMGEYVRYWVDIAHSQAAPATRVTVDQSHRAGNVVFAPGTAVRVAIAKTQLRLLSA